MHLKRNKKNKKEVHAASCTKAPKLLKYHQQICSAQEGWVQMAHHYRAFQLAMGKPTRRKISGRGGGGGKTNNNYNVKEKKKQNPPPTKTNQQKNPGKSILEDQVLSGLEAAETEAVKP